MNPGLQLSARSELASEDGERKSWVCRAGSDRGRGKGIPSREKTWNIWLKTRNPHRDFGLKLWKTFVFIPHKKWMMNGII